MKISINFWKPFSESFAISCDYSSWWHETEPTSLNGIWQRNLSGISYETQLQITRNLYLNINNVLHCPWNLYLHFLLVAAAERKMRVDILYRRTFMLAYFVVLSALYSVQVPVVTSWKMLPCRFFVLYSCSSPRCLVFWMHFKSNLNE